MTISIPSSKSHCSLEKNENCRDINSNIKILKQGQQIILTKLQQRAQDQLSLLEQMKEFYRKKSELDLEYGRSIEKLARSFQSKTVCFSSNDDNQYLYS